MNGDVLPDSRLQHVKKGIVRGFHVLARRFLNWEPIFCANCGAPGGFVPQENMTFAFYLCNQCVDTYGQIAGMMLVPDEVFWAQVAADQEEQRQHERERGNAEEASV